MRKRYKVTGISAGAESITIAIEKSTERRRSMVFCSKCGKKLNEGARFCPRCGAPVGEQGGSGTSISQSGGGSSGTFSWDQAGQMRDLSREFQESDVEQNKLMAQCH